MDTFLSCDWGTSAFRLRVIRIPDLAVLAETHSDEGTAATFDLWQQSGQPEANRVSFYRTIIAIHIASLEEELATTLQQVPVILSGMASSSIGMKEVPYKKMPFAMDGSDLQLDIQPATDTFPHQLILISGVRSDRDVMRGEETKLVGCNDNISPGTTSLFVFPGTHAKHIRVKDGIATDFNTYMTGEFFQLLSQKSILAASVEKVDGLDSESYQQYFKEGVQQSGQYNLLHNSFLVRTNDLFQKMTKQENYCFLSGLCIGTEWRQLVPEGLNTVYIVCGDKLMPYYKAAAEVVPLQAQLHFLPADELLIKGQYNVYQKVVAT